MSDAMDFLNKLNIFLTKVFFPLTEFEDEEDIQILFREIGIDISSAPTLFADLAALIGEIANIVDDFENSNEKTDNQDLHQSVFKIVINIINTIRSLSEEGENISSFSADDIFISLLDYLLCHNLQEETPVLYEVFILCGIIDTTEKTLVIGSEEHTYQERKIDYSGALAVVTDPLQRLKVIYDWDSDNFNVPLLIDRISNLLSACDVFSDFDTMPSNINSVLGANTKSFDINNFTDYSGTVLESKIPLGEGLGGFNILLYPLYSVDGAKCDGIAVGVGFSGEINIAISLLDNLQIKLTTNASVNNGAGMAFRKNSPITFFQNLFTDEGNQLSGSLNVSFLGELVYESEDERTILLGCSNGSSISTASADLSVGVLNSGSKPLDIFVELHLFNCEIVINTKDGDSFISKLLGDEEIKANFDFGFGWSCLTGIYFSGSAALEVTIPLHAKLGPILIESVFLGVKFDGESIEISIACSFGAKLGPINASIDRIGLIVPFTFPPQRNGNLGPIDIQTPSFLPPTGAGLSVDAESIIGGGFLEFDHENNRYAGVLSLAFGEIGLTAIGLITTRMPDGSPGFSMLISVNVKFSPEIQLSMGFTLSALGGLIGINRTMDLTVLEKRFRNRALDSILLPKDPILNASRIISDMRSVFPPKENRFVIGAMAEIGYGNPKIMSGKIGIIIELPEPVRAAIMGQVSVVLPDKGKSIIVLNLDVLGIINFSKKKLSITASLYDSRILSLNIFGDAVIWLKWGHNPHFIMSLGGFHPRFTPPPGFPKLRRLMMSLNWGDVLFMSFQFYMAQTPNSLQFGARFDLRIKLGPAEITGGMSFDTLFYFSPFYFEADITGYVAVKIWRQELASIHLSFNLSGPTPWHAIGSARFKVLWKTFKVDFDVIRGPVSSVTPIAPVDPWDPLKEALCRREAWGSSLPPARIMVESLRPIDEPKDVKDNENIPVLVHPAGKLEVRQNVLPFEVTLEKFGNAPVKDHNYFSITSITSGNKLECKPVEEYFAKKPFKNLTIKEQLSSESYELQQAGIEITSEAIKVPGKMKAKSLEYEVIPIDDDGTSKQQGNGRLSWDAGKRLMKMTAAGQSLIRRKGHRAFEIPDNKPGIHVNEEKCRIVFNSNMKSVSALKYIVPNYQEDMKRSEAEAALEKYLRKHPENLGKVQMVNSYEVLV
jgi:Family of unknown function (DUF6603)